MDLINFISFDFAAIDRLAWTIFIVGWIIVFFVLITLSIIYRHLPKVTNRIEEYRDKLIKAKKEKKSLKAEQEKLKAKEKIAKEEAKSGDSDDEIYVAISAALNLYLDDQHDEESYVLTIDRDSALYSPWSAKIYNINNI